MFDAQLTPFATCARKTGDAHHQVKSWLICDGDVDPEWIESLNSVLDDNHLLTLPNGERISFGNNVNFVFETHDLKFASPATVSRMGKRRKPCQCTLPFESQGTMGEHCRALNDGR